MPILAVEDYPSIRSAVGFWIDEKLVPNEVLEQMVFIPSSESDIKMYVPDAETKTGAELFMVKNATIYWTAYKLAMSFPQLVEQAILSDRLKFMPIPISEKLEFLLAERNRNLLELGVTIDQMRVFSLGDGYKEDLQREALYWGYYDRFPQLYRSNEYRVRSLDKGDEKQVKKKTYYY